MVLYQEENSTNTFREENSTNRLEESTPERPGDTLGRRYVDRGFVSDVERIMSNSNLIREILARLDNIERS